jgi:hypothetical protein
VSSYVGNASEVDRTGELFDGLDAGKGCIRFKKTVAPADTRSDEFVVRALSLRAGSADIDC